MRPFLPNHKFKTDEKMYQHDYLDKVYDGESPEKETYDNTEKYVDTYEENLCELLASRPPALSLEFLTYR